ncbi:hypothetical protein C8A01DRAFT_17458 [Parachaetomium inaequale]|uniref:Uncharacterized protein n=1 Tax=Parachaetomium inaequale TaxID=2588326 RepID=A0AAN6SQ57_9PEZI|nr:hypothetical protein C8A01DRAFT_17458 [Parachaetomium inaequale]
MPDDDESNNSKNNKNNNNNNPFIRFRHHVDANITAGLTTLSSLTTPSPHHQIPPNPITTMPTTTPSTPTMLTPSDQHIESRIALLTGGTPAEANLAWHLFLTRSAYSPLRLEHDPALGFAGTRNWKPTPRDLPTGCEVEVGWLEAFEDLMRVESGLGLVDLDHLCPIEREKGGGFLGPFHHWNHHHRRGMVGFLGGDWSGMREVAWLERMRSRGLTEVLFPVYDPGLGFASPRTVVEWAERRRAEERREREVGRVWEELVGGARRTVEEARREVEREADAWAEDAKREMKREVDAWRDVAHEKGASFFDGIGGVVKTLGKVLEDEVKSLQRVGREKDTKQHEDEKAVEKKEAPETENDLYSVIQSAFHESERSLSNFFKAISDGRRDDRLREPKPASPPKVNTTEVVEDGITKKTTRREFVDEHGNTHSKTETTWTDESGQVVMRQVHSSMGRSEHWGETAQKGEDTAKNTPADQDRETPDEPKAQHKESGWFWK